MRLKWEKYGQIYVCQLKDIQLHPEPSGDGQLRTYEPPHTKCYSNNETFDENGSIEIGPEPLISDGSGGMDNGFNTGSNRVLKVSWRNSLSKTKTRLWVVSFIWDKKNKATGSKLPKE